jgi:hypothetical protein
MTAFRPRTQHTSIACFLTKMDAPTLERSLINDLEARHEDLLLRIDELDRKVQKTLAEWLGGRESLLENVSNVPAR